ncbi:hypothetical protein [Halarcobacter sp.]|uniref:hypothetical protein n=1 Tax=Halarcobacter sp. TaxID=2321133 RepID=UPI0029F505BF|nr:hypothetical protein [Halarcobacter sp.]
MSEDIECEKEKKKFFKYVKGLIFLIAVYIVLYFTHSIDKNRVDKIAIAFENNQELICDNKVVSSTKGYKYYKKESNLITDGDNIFELSKCLIKE